MIEVVTDMQIYSFDGRVFEIFEIEGDSKRFHLAYINSIEFAPRRKEYRLTMSYSKFDRPVIYGITQEDAPKLEPLVQAIKEALA